MTGIPCPYPGDTVTCQHCNGTKEMYVCTKCHDFQASNCTIIRQYLLDPTALYGAQQDLQLYPDTDF
jgi:hypothetical protein